MTPRDGPTVVHVTTVHRWDDNRILQRECRSLAHAGYRVALVAPAGDAPAHDDDVRIVTVDVPARRWARVGRGLPRALRAARAERAAVYHLHDPELLAIAPALKLRGARVVYDAHEDLPADVRGKHYLPRPVRFLARALASLLVFLAGRLCDHVVAATATVAARFPAARRTVVRNYPRHDASTVPPPWADRPPTAIYVGAISVDRGARDLLAAAEDLPAGWRLRLVGPCRSAPLRAEIRAATERAPVDWTGPVPPPVARRMLTEARIGLVVLHATPAYVDALPTKLFEYMSAGLPVVASDFPDWRAIVAGTDCGTLVVPGDPAIVAGAVRALASDPQAAEAAGERGRAAVATTYGWEPEAQHLVALYRRLTGGPVGHAGIGAAPRGSG